MKKLLLLSVLFVSLFSFAQVPQGISYQAIALNGSGSPVVSSNVRVKLSILDVSATGTVLYSETHLKMTNSQGLFNLVIGQGTVVSGVFATINWGTNSKFLKVEMDATGGTTFAAVGTTQLLTVPYAMAAASLVPSNGNSIADEINQNKITNFGFIDYSGNKAYVFNAKRGTWSNQSFNGNSSPDLMESKGNFGFVDYSDNKVYAFNSNTNAWSAQLFNGNSSPDLITSESSFGFVDYSDNKVYAFNTRTGAWVAQLFNGNSSPTLAGQNGNFAFVDYSDNKAYAFNQKVGAWSSQTFNSNSSPDIISVNGSMAFIDFSDNKVYAFNAITGTWVAQPFNASSSPTLISSPN